ncbi:hypothetical protein [Streptomyces werraensis]|uniref:hypothetical protein n=1 Tax=Streptomyces werraensis TaxID=68284 RepID=UPI00380D3A7D
MDDWAAGMQAYARAQGATLALAGRKEFGTSDGMLRHLARRTGLHVDRLAHTVQDEPELAASAYQPYTTSELRCSQPRTARRGPDPAE